MTPYYFNQIKNCLPELPSIHESALETFNRWGSSVRNILPSSLCITSAMYICSRMSTSYSEFVYYANLLSLIVSGGYALKTRNIDYFAGSIIANNVTGLFFTTINPLYPFIGYAVANGLIYGSNKPTKEIPPIAAANQKQIVTIELPTVDQTIAAKTPEELRAYWPQFHQPAQKSSKENTSILLYKPKKSVNPMQASDDLATRLIDCLERKFCIHKIPREELAKAFAFLYSNEKKNDKLTTKYIALNGSKHSGIESIVCAIAKELHIPVIEIFSDTPWRDIEKITKRLDRKYILLEHLDEESFPDHLIGDEAMNLLYRPSNILNIFINHRKAASADAKKRLMPDLPSELLDQCGEVIEFSPLKKADYKALLYQKRNPHSFYGLQENLKKKNRILEVDEIPALIVEKCLQRIMKSKDPQEMEKMMKDLFSLLVQQSSPENPREPITVQLHSLPSHFMPSELTMTGMKAVLDERIVGQEMAKQTMIEAIFFHLQSNGDEDEEKLPKGNILLIGPSGSGKTFIVETMARHLNIPLAVMDLSRVTREGYIGPKISDVFTSLIDSANGDIEKASRGIVFFDEADKIFEDAANGFNEITGLSIQNQLLCMLQGDSIRVGQDKYGWGGKTLKTKDILFIFAGAFHKQTRNSEGKQLDDEQLIAGGVRPEFLGRIGYISQLTALTHEEIKKILTHGPNATLSIWKRQFKKFGFELVMKEETLDQIVKNAMNKETGARGLHYEVRSKLSKLLASLIMEQENTGESAFEDELKRIEV